MDHALKWRRYLEIYGIPGNTIKVYCGSATPFMVKSGNHSERAAYYECHFLTIMGRINGQGTAATGYEAADRRSCTY